MEVVSTQAGQLQLISKGLEQSSNEIFPGLGPQNRKVKLQRNCCIGQFLAFLASTSHRCAEKVDQRRRNKRRCRIRASVHVLVVSRSASNQPNRVNSEQQGD